MSSRQAVRLRAMAIVFPLLALVASLVAPPAASAPSVRVIVQARDVASAVDAVEAAGGQVTMRLPIVSGAAAAVPADRMGALASTAGVRAVTPDVPVRLAEAGGGAADPAHVVQYEVGAYPLWKEGVDGAGIRVALIDTGVSPVGDLAGRVVGVPHPTEPGETAECANLSGEPTCADSYGHGTFVAGLIAGSGAASAGAYRGMAPGAEIVSVKIAGRDGSADVSKVLAGIQYVVSFKDRLRIRVLNLSLGTDSRVDWRYDPLNLAVERAWDAGIAVVVAASNRGPDAETISKPADDPLVITVGAVDDRGTPAAHDDRLPRFSGRGPTAHGLAKPDLVAPGARLISLRSPGSFIEEQVPGGGIDETYRRGSGTSMSAAVISGISALVLQEHPDWTPDRLKYALKSTSRVVASHDPMDVGAGMPFAWNTVHRAPEGIANTDVTTRSDGSGSLDASRGNVRVSRPCGDLERMIDPTCERVEGEETARRGVTWDGDEYADGDWTGATWYESQWNPVLGSSWYTTSWYGDTWVGDAWWGSSWYGASSDDAYGKPVLGSSWYGSWE